MIAIGCKALESYQSEDVSYLDHCSTTYFVLAPDLCYSVEVVDFAESGPEKAVNT